MNENLNLVEILKDCPKGTKLYSIVFGDIKFEGLIKDESYPILIRMDGSRIRSFSADGKMYYGFGECVLFPSKDQRDWSKFTAPWYKKEQAPSQTNERTWLHLVSDVLTWKNGIGQYLDNPRVQELAKRLCSEYAQKLYNPSVIEDKKPKNKVTEPSYRPFKNKDECWDEMLEHQPFGWFRHKKEGYYAPMRIDISEDTLFKSLFNTYTFADGTPFGILEN